MFSMTSSCSGFVFFVLDSSFWTSSVYTQGICWNSIYTNFSIIIVVYVYVSACVRVCWCMNVCVCVLYAFFFILLLLFSSYARWRVLGVLSVDRIWMHALYNSIHWPSELAWAVDIYIFIYLYTYSKANLCCFCVCLFLLNFFSLSCLRFIVHLIIRLPYFHFIH